MPRYVIRLMSQLSKDPEVVIALETHETSSEQERDQIVADLNVALTARPHSNNDLFINVQSFEEE